MRRAVTTHYSNDTPNNRKTNVPSPAFNDLIDASYYTMNTLEKTSRAMLYGGMAMLCTGMVEQQMRHALGEKTPVNLLNAFVGGMLFGAFTYAMGDIHPDEKPLSASFKRSLFYLAATSLSLHAGDMMNAPLFGRGSVARLDHMLRAGAALAYPCYRLDQSIPAIGEYLNTKASQLFASVKCVHVSN